MTTPETAEELVKLLREMRTLLDKAIRVIQGDLSEEDEEVSA